MTRHGAEPVIHRCPPATWESFGAYIHRYINEWIQRDSLCAELYKDCSSQMAKERPNVSEKWVFLVITGEG